MKSPNLICHSYGLWCYKHVIILLFFCITFLSNSQTYPPQVTVNSVTWESYQYPSNLPPYQTSFTDPVTGNNVTRISDEVVFGCDCSKLRHRYAKNQAWNADGTLIMTSGSPSRILDGETYQVLYESYTKALWSNTDPHYTYDASSNARLVKKNIITNQETVLRQFSGYTSISVGNNEGNLSNDDRYVALIASSGSQNTVLVYDILNDQIVGTKSLGTADIDWVSVSQTGDYVVISGYSDGSGPLQGIKAYDKFMNNEIHLYNGRPHGDIGFDTQGNEVFVGYQGISGYSLSYARLDNGQKQGLFPYSGATGDRGLWGGHISTRNLDRPGWAYVSDQGHPTDINRHEATREIFAIKLDGSQTIERFAKHNSNINISGGYNHQAHAVPNRDGSKVLFASNWDISSLENNNYPVMFVVEAPQSPNGIVANAGTDVSICDGETTTLTASGGSTYLWSTGDTTASIDVSPTTTTTYTVTVFDATGNNSDTDDVIVTVNEIPTANAGNDIETCQGTAVTLTASGGTSYLWNTGDTTATISVNPNATTTYSVEVTQNGCIATDDVIVTVNEIPDVDAGQDETIFLGENITLTATGADSYLWSTGETTQSITVNPVVDTSYSVTGTTNNCESTDSVSVFLLDDSVNASAGNDTEICNGESTTLTATGGTTYVWNTGETTASIEVTPTTTTTYTVTAFSVSGNNSEDASVTVTVNDIPTVNAGNDIAICFGNSTDLVASGGTTYLWNTGETSATISVSPNTTTTYTVEVFDNGCSSTDDVTVTINPLPETNAGTDVTITEGESTTLTASGADTYLWSTGETTASITVSPNNTTTYSVTGFSNGCESSDDVTVSVVTENVNANAGEDVTICNGESTTLTASGGATYQWNTGETTSSIEVTPSTTTTYTVTVFSTSGAISDDDSVTVTVNELPSTNAGTDVTITEGESTTLTASGADTYVWSTGETTASITVSPNSTATYSVTGFSNGCESSDEVTVSVVTENVNANAGEDVTICNGESTTLTASGGATYQWSTGETTASITVNPNSTTTYTVTAFNTSQTVSDEDTVTVSVNELPTTNAGTDVTITEGESTTLTASGADTYVWSTGETTANITVSPNSTTTYSVTGFSNGCESSDDVTVSVVTENVNANAGEDVTICNGESTTLTASGGATYQWSTGETTASITVNPNSTTTYTVTAFNTSQTASDEDTVTVSVNELPSTNAGTDVTITEGESTTLTASGADTYVWSTGETTASITVSPNSTTTYSVTGFSNGCELSDDVLVTVDDFEFTASAGADQSICQGYETTLTASEGDSYLWSTGETTQSITVNPANTQTYSVTVFFNGYQADADVMVSVNPNPNVVIENGDDVMILEGEFVTLSATGANTYLWNNGATQPNIAVSPSATTTYEVTGYINNCEDTKAITVNVLDTVEADAGDDLFICSEETVTLTANGGEEYLWNTGETTQSIEVSPNEDTEYSVLVYNALDSDEATVTVYVEDCNIVVTPEETEAFDFIVFQEPINDVLKVKIDGLQSITATGISIYDMAGKLLYEERFNQSELQNQSDMTREIDTSPYARGIYIVRLIYNDTAMTKKIPIR